MENQENIVTEEACHTENCSCEENCECEENCGCEDGCNSESCECEEKENKKTISVRQDRKNQNGGEKDRLQKAFPDPGGKTRETVSVMQATVSFFLV